MMYDVACSCSRGSGRLVCKAVGWRGCVHYNGIVMISVNLVGRNVLKRHWCLSRITQYLFDNLTSS
jgi:hypothetical protein